MNRSFKFVFRSLLTLIVFLNSTSLFAYKICNQSAEKVFLATAQGAIVWPGNGMGGTNYWRSSGWYPIERFACSDFTSGEGGLYYYATGENGSIWSGSGVNSQKFCIIKGNRFDFDGISKHDVSPIVTTEARCVGSGGVMVPFARVTHDRENLTGGTGSGGGGNSPGNLEECIDVSSTQGWQPYQLKNVTGFYRVTAIHGFWTVDRAKPLANPWVGHQDPSLDPFSQYKFDKRYPFGTVLIATNSDNMQMVDVSTQFLGRGWLRINDSDATLGDNSGAVKVCFHP